MHEGWVEALLDATLSDYSAAAFVLWASAASSYGISNPASWDASLGGLKKVISREKIEQIGQAHFTTTINQVKDMRRAVPSKNPASDAFPHRCGAKRPLSRCIKRDPTSSKNTATQPCARVEQPPVDNREVAGSNRASDTK